MESKSYTNKALEKFNQACFTPVSKYVNGKYIYKYMVSLKENDDFDLMSDINHVLIEERRKL